MKLMSGEANVVYLVYCDDSSYLDYDGYRVDEDDNIDNYSYNDIESAYSAITSFMQEDELIGEEHSYKVVEKVCN